VGQAYASQKVVGGLARGGDDRPDGNISFVKRLAPHEIALVRAWRIISYGRAHWRERELAAPSRRSAIYTRQGARVACRVG
jgi:hypothetical protein